MSRERKSIGSLGEQIVWKNRKSKPSPKAKERERESLKRRGIFFFLDSLLVLASLTLDAKCCVKIKASTVLLGKAKEIERKPSREPYRN